MTDAIRAGVDGTKPRYTLSDECTCQGAKVGRPAFFIIDSQAPERAGVVMCKIYDYAAALVILEALNKP